MISPHPSLSPQRRRPSFARRWLALGLLTVLLHTLAMLWVDGSIVLTGPQAAMQPDSAELKQVVVALAPPAPVPAAVPVAPPVRKPRLPAKTAAAPAAPPVNAALPGDSTMPPAESNAISTKPVTLPAEPEPVPQPPQEAVVVAPPAVPPPPAPQYRFQPPPSVTLKYDVEKIAADGKNYYGSGSISWLMNEGHYTIDGDAGVLFISALNFKSSGDLDRWGISPEIYTEKKFRRSATNTHFNRERDLISFSASEVNYPRKGGEQDRASIIWQLAGIGRGDSDKIAIGAELPIFVAGVRDGEIWPIRVVGKETIDIGPGKTSVWHLVRSPKPGSYDQVLDIWLAPQMEWYPVKLRFTETNGDYLDMSLKSLRSPPTR